MSEPINTANMSLAPGVMETIIALEASQVKGVAPMEAPAPSGGFAALFGKKAAHGGIEVVPTGDGTVDVALHLQMLYGYVLPDVAAEVREAVAEALRLQAGMEAGRVDIFVDGIVFA